MSVDVVPASPSRGMIVASLLRLIIRIALALLALWALAFASDRYEVYLRDSHLLFRIDAGLWLLWMGAAVAAGLLFGLAIWLPFTGVRFAWSGLVLAAVAFAPIAQFWWVWIYQLQRQGEVGGWLYRAGWFIGAPTQTALAVLTGVAIASVFQAKSPESVGPDN
jgi:hypothetical protein